MRWRARYRIDPADARDLARALGITSVLLLFASCESPFTPPATGALTVMLATSGVDPDTDGYSVSLDSGTARPVASDGTVRYDTLTPGHHLLVVAGIAPNCGANDNPRTVDVPVNGDAQVVVPVICAANTGSLAVWVETLPTNGAGGYTLYLDGQPFAQVPSIGGTTVGGVAVGHHTVTLGGSGIGSQCGIDPVGVDVVFGHSTQLTLIVSCGLGSLNVKTTTSGGDLDPNGYAVTVDSAWVGAATPNGAVVVGPFLPGSHRVGIAGVASNCTADSLSRTASVTASGIATVPFVLTCHSQTAGSIVVRAVTTGIDLDLDGYTVSLDGIAKGTVAANDAFSIGSVTPGTHAVALSGVSANCSLDSASRGANVVIDSTRIVTFNASCQSTTGSLQVAVTTTGADPDPDGYTITVDGVAAGGVASNATTTIASVAIGGHAVALTGIAANCFPDSSSRSVTIASSSTATVAFAVACVASPRLRAITQTSGQDIDNNGYLLTFMDSAPWSVPLGSNGDTVIVGLKAGQETVSLADVAGNCQVSGGNSRTVSLVLAETTTVTFQITCVAVPRDIAFNDESSGGISVMSEIGSGLLHLVNSGWNPAWSPDGSKIGFIANTCGPEGCHTDIYTMHPDGTGISQLFIGGAGTLPDWIAWKPDGSSLAFSGQYNGTYGVYVVTADGSTVTPVITGVGGYHPTWSPDGGKIAFTCQIDSGNNDICTVNSDGTGLLRLTTDPGVDEYPAWKPDGSKIMYVRMATAFTGLAAINPDGSGQAGILAYSVASSAAWSPDGQKIVFTVQGGCYGSWSYSYCNPDEILVVNADGTNVSTINGAGNSPAWRP